MTFVLLSQSIVPFSARKAMKGELLVRLGSCRAIA
jgi:hypothetical protein